MPTYLVKVTAKESKGVEFEITRQNKEEAIREAKYRVNKRMIYDWHDRPIVYTATKISEQQQGA